MTVTIDGKVVGVGATIGTGYTYMGDGDGYYWALVAKDDGDTDRVSYAGSYHAYGGTVDVDATDAIIAAVAAKVRPMVASRNYNYATKNFKDIGKGDTVTVVRGRKIPIGTVAVVGWFGDDNYSRYGTRVGLIIDGAMVFTAGHNVDKVVDPDDYSDAALKAWNDVAAMSDIDVIRTHYGVTVGVIN